MGNLNNNQLSSVTVYDPNLWILLAHDQSYDIVRNSQTGVVAEAYTVPVDNSVSLEQNLQRYEARKQKNLNFVKIYEVSRYQNSYLCQGNPMFKVMTQRIPIRLSQTKNLSISEGLYIFSQALLGFNYIFEMKQFFSINDNLIGFTEKGQVRLWLNQNFGSNYPNQKLQQVRQSLSQRGNTNNDLELRIINEIYLAIEPHLQGNAFPKRFSDEFKNSQLHTIKQANILIQNYITRERIQKLRAIKNTPNSKFPTDLYTNLSQNPTPIKLQQIEHPPIMKIQSKPQIKAQNNQLLYSNRSFAPNTNQSSQFIQPIQIPMNQNLIKFPKQQNIKTNPNIVNTNQSIRINKQIPLGQPIRLSSNQNLIPNQQINKNIQIQNSSFKVNLSPPQTIINQNSMINNNRFNIQSNKQIPVQTNQILIKNNNNTFNNNNNNNFTNNINNNQSILQRPINTSMPIRVNQNIPVNTVNNAYFRPHTSITTNPTSILRRNDIPNDNGQINNELLKNKVNKNSPSFQLNNLKQFQPSIISESPEIKKIDSVSQKRHVTYIQPNNLQKITQNTQQFLYQFRKAESKFVPVANTESTHSVEDLASKQKFLSKLQPQQNQETQSFEKKSSFTNDKKQTIHQESKQMTENQIQEIRNVLSEEVINYLPETIPSTHDNTYKLEQNNYQYKYDPKPYVIDYTKFSFQDHNLPTQIEQTDYNYQYKQEYNIPKYNLEQNYQTSYNYGSTLNDVQYAQPIKKYQFEKYIDKNQTKVSTEVDQPSQVPSYEQLRSTLLESYDINNNKVSTEIKDYSTGYLQTYNNQFKYNF